MKTRTPPAPRRLGLLLVAALAGAACAQDGGSPAAEDAALQLAQVETERRVVIHEGGHPFGATDPGPERVVKGAPYCADATHETVQWLVDGQGGAPNRITRLVQTRSCRDGEGRTRQEVERDGRKLVYLRDPVAHENWLLDPERKTARRLGAGAASGMDAAVWRDFAERTRDWARGLADRARPGVAPVPPVPPAPPAPAVAPVPPLPPVPPVPVFITETEGSGGPARPGEVRERREVRIMRSGRDGAPPLEGAMPPPEVQWRAQVLAPRGPGVVTPLPARDVEGVRANGERTTWTIEAGKVGNDKPIQITREVWTAPELMLTLQTRDFDPRSGELNFRLKNLRRGEPDAALMRVPADYAKLGAAPRAPRPTPGASGPTG